MKKNEYILINKNNKHEQWILYFFFVCGIIIGSEFLYFYGFLFVSILFMNAEYVEQVSTKRNDEDQEIIVVKKNRHLLKNERFYLYYFKIGRYFMIVLGAAILIADISLHIQAN